MTQSTEMFRGFICGVVSGWSQVFVMQPFQIIKVRLVTQSLASPAYSGIIHCAKRIFKEEGLKSFYRGTLSPLVGYGLEGSLAFGFNQVFKKILKKLDLTNEAKEGKILPLGQVFLSGIFTGMMTTIALTPADHVRIQLQKQIGKGKYKGSIDASQDMYKRFGLKGLYTGFHATFLRQVIALSIFFYTYQYTMRLFAPEGLGSLHAPLMVSFFAGGLAGANSWLFTYPIDYIKTLMQSQNLEQVKYKTSMKCAIDKYQTEGYRTFFKGLGITMLRSFPVNAVAFFSFQYLMRITGWKKE